MKRMHWIISLALVAPTLLPAAEDRFLQPIDTGRVAAMKGHMHPGAQPANDRGPVDRSLELSYVTLLLKPAPGLDRFLQELENPSSPDYHRWLTPEEFADRFGLSRNDTAKITAWLESQGLRVHDVARGRHWITFSGTAENVERALRTEIHRYAVDGETHYANATEPSVPEALSGVVAGFTGLHDFRPRRLSIARKLADGTLADYTSGATHYMAPDDFAVIYNLMPLLNQGLDGTGQKIVVAGQTNIVLSDIQAFRRRFSLPANDPQVVLYGFNPGITDDLVEADLDIQWAGAVARNATIIYVYSQDVSLSAQYAVDQNLAPVITYSYGACELYFTPEYRYIAQQAAAQGITWLASSGDSGAAECDRHSPTSQAAKGATTSFPATIPEITAVGGTTFDEGDGTYWQAKHNASGMSAMSYIPERVWNDVPDTGSMGGSGGGASALYSKPLWQTGPGVPNDNARDVPDVSLSASLHDGYLVMMGGGLYVLGGTSAGAPAMAGVVAMLNQYLASKGILSGPGLGNMNPMLYRLAQASPDIFHDITAGDNKVPCVQGSPGCVEGMVGFAAGPGYDLATGLGSIDAYSLVTKWSASAASTTTLTAAPAKVGLDDQVQLTATVSATSASKPGGSVAFLANDDLVGTATLSAAGGTATATLSVAAVRLVAGDGTVTALYSGDGVFSPSSGKTTVSLNLPQSGSMVVPAITPNPVYQTSSHFGTEWDFTVTLAEKAGVNTRLTRFADDSADYSAQIVSWFGTATIRGNRSISASLYEDVVTPPMDKTYYFEGVDGDGTTWSRKLTVRFVSSAAPALFPAIKMTGVPAANVDNSQADPSCGTYQHLVLQETGGYLVQLSKFTVGGLNYTSNIQQLFGTTRLAPFGMLEATVCRSGPTFGSSYGVTGTAETGDPVAATLAIPGATLPAGASIAASPAAVTIAVPKSAPGGAATVSLKFSGSATPWSIAVLPANGLTGWLTVSPISGTGDAQVNLKASGTGLSSGAYRAVLAVQTSGTSAAYLMVPATFVAGASSTTTIAAITNNFSGKTAVAPGMMAAVWGSALAPAGTSALASRLPLPLSLAGVSATVNGITAPLYYVSPGQLDVQIPYEAGAGPAVLAVNNNGQVAAFPFTIAVAAPGIAAGANGTLFPAAAQQGQAYTIYITGDGDVTPFLATGAAAAGDTAVSDLPGPRLPLRVTVGGVDATITFAGIPSWGAGVTQVNFTVPKTAPLGAQPVVVMAGSVASPPATLTVTQ